MKTIIVRIEVSDEEYKRYKQVMSVKEMKEFLAYEAQQQLESYTRMKEGFNDRSEHSSMKW